MLTLAALAAAAAVTLAAAGPADAITPDNCGAARAFGYTQTDIEAAADAALAADVILEAVPQDTLDAVPRAAAVTAWAIPQGVLRGFSHSYDIAQACDDNDHQQLVKDNLDAKVSTRATQTSVTSVQTTVNHIQSSTDSSSTALDEHAALDLRLQIESSLAAGRPIALFELPHASGGYIEMTRSIVADTIAKMQAASQPVNNATTLLAKGDAYLAAHKYKLAYAAYGKGYRIAAKSPDSN
jgi:hypothetical protein